MNSLFRIILFAAILAHPLWVEADFTRSDSQEHSADDSPEEGLELMVELRINVTVPQDSGKVYLTGNTEALGNWKPNGLLLQGEQNKRSAVISVPQGFAVEFKLTQGSWNTEALNADFTAPENTIITVNESTEVDVVVNQFRSALLDVPYPDPARYQPDIDLYLKQDQVEMPTAGGILAIGSSNMLNWQATIQQDLAPLHIVPRAFGGSMMNDYVYFFPSIVLPYKPRAILLYGGSNDLAHGVFPETVVERFKEFISLIHQHLPECRVYVLGPIPSPSREEFRARTDHLNNLLREECSENSLLAFIDVTTPLLDDAGKAKAVYFVEDQLHLNQVGYKLWANTIRPVLMSIEYPFETQLTK
ncbi:MAG: GDSL-type esterase/lipase family protein [Sumerlaeia bacterium]